MHAAVEEAEAAGGTRSKPAPIQMEGCSGWKPFTAGQDYQLSQGVDPGERPQHVYLAFVIDDFSRFILA